VAKNRLTCFGGKREAGEDPGQCINRECQVPHRHTHTHTHTHTHRHTHTRERYHPGVLGALHCTDT
jgi:hypothetical protein